MPDSALTASPRPEQPETSESVILIVSDIRIAAISVRFVKVVSEMVMSSAVWISIPLPVLVKIDCVTARSNMNGSKNWPFSRWMPLAQLMNIAFEMVTSAARRKASPV